MALCHNALTPTTEMLVSAAHAEIQTEISHGLHLTWESERLEGYTRQLCAHVNQFQEKIFDLSKYVERMDRLIKEIDDIDVVVAAEDMTNAMNADDMGAGGLGGGGKAIDDAKEEGAEGEEGGEGELFNKKRKGGDDAALAKKVDFRKRLQQIFASMQAVIDEMNLAQYSNLERWVKTLQESIHAKLLDRLQEIIQEWVSQFQKWPQQGVTLIQ